MKFYKKFKDKIKSIQILLMQTLIYYYYYHRKVNNQLVYIESKSGEDFAGNMLRIAEELSKPEYGKLRIIFFVKKEKHCIEKYRALIKRYGIKNYHLETNRYRAACYMEIAKYIFTDANLRPEYVKKDGQIVVNTWHGTPLKKMGKENITEKINVGTQQRINLNCDYLIYPNAFMADAMLKDYMIENLTTAKILWEGYPRNSVFFDSRRRDMIKEELGFIHKHVYAYMPTYRGIWWKSNEVQSNNIETYLDELDNLLFDDEVLLVKLHLYTRNQLSNKTYNHILFFPESYETYDILNAADCLITDYSSVLFDFANSKKKIVLFAYDEEEYLKDRGVYLQLSDLPFPIVKNSSALIKEIRSPIAYDDSSFINQFCTYDNINAVKHICHHVVLCDHCCKEGTLNNNKENVLIFAGALNKNGITTALLSLLKSLDNTKNYFVSVRKADINNAPERLNLLPDNINYLVMDTNPCSTLKETADSQKYSRNRSLALELPSSLQKLYTREWIRNYGETSFSHIIQFDGYGIDINLMYLLQPTNKTIFVHNDMRRELLLKSWQHPATLKLCYSGYTSVAVVSKDLIEPTAAISGCRDNIIVVNNVHDVNTIQQKASEAIEFQNQTVIHSFSPIGLNEVLNSNKIKFITIGRFAKEKNHILLIDAFNDFWLEEKNSYLIIIGGYGPLFDQTIKKARSVASRTNIFIIQSIENPFPILNKSSLFILPSRYEGLPITIKEADTLGIPVLATVIPSMQSFADEYGLYQVSQTKNGLYQGMKDYMRGRISPMYIDYIAYNQKALNEFQSIFTFD